MNCSNHACKEKINVSEGDQVYHTCSLCREPVYCSEECRLVDWAIGHACPNVVEVAAPLSTRSVAVPYLYEDCLRPEDLERLPANDPVFASYSFMYHDVTRGTEQAFVSSLAPTGREEKKQENTVLPQGKFLVKITTAGVNAKPSVRQTLVAGEAPHDVIFAGNRSNAKASLLAKGEKTQAYWIHDGLKKLKTSERPRSEQWLTHVGIQVCDAANEDNVLYSLQTTIDQGLCPSASQVSARPRIISANLEQHLGRKFQGSTKDLQVWRAIDPNTGTRALITTRPYAKVGWEIVDLVLDSPSAEDQKGMAIVHPDTYHVDARDYSQMNGLIMAIETELAAGAHPQLATLERVAPTVRAYVLSMADQNGQAPRFVPSEVKSAVNTAIETLYAPIGLQPSIDYWRRKMLAPYDKVKRELYDLVAKMNREREAAAGKRGLRKVIGRLGKSVNLRKLQAAATALGEFVTRLRNPDLSDCSQQVVQQYQELQDLVIRATQDVVEVPTE